MWAALEGELVALLAARIRELYGVEHAPVVEVPPRRELGDFAFPAPLHLARQLKKPPRAIAQELLDGLTAPAWVREVRLAGAGYLNVFLARSQAMARLLQAPPLVPAAGEHEKIIVEHTNINPNKAAHIGHLRNAVLGDVLVATLRALGHPVEVQNYVDDTGVQVADVVVGCLDLRGLTLEQVAAVPEPFDYWCWDLYSEVGRWYEGDPSRQALRRETLHELERGQGARAEMGQLVARRVLVRHLATMRRLGIGYDVLTHEADILALDFFHVAFERLKAVGVVRLETDGKNAGCWMMPLAHAEEFAGLEEPDKVIVRSDGTVTYVGKDIAYQLWKFGLLGKDFQYRCWEEERVWETCAEGGVADHPPFGRAGRVVNVIDIRQSYLQKIVRAGLEALGHAEQAERSVHFAYEMVALSPAAARTLGVAVEGEDGETKTLEMSGRKGIGVKADDLIDQLIAKAREEIAARNRELAEAELQRLAVEIATAAMRFFMVKASTNRVIAFDFAEALAFEGESGPYLQYAVVRWRNIQRKLAAAGLPTAVTAEEAVALPEEAWADDLWDLALHGARLGETVERAGRALELSLIARHALELAQRFNAVYHRHPILQEPDVTLRAARLAASQAFAAALGALAGVLGIPLPERM
ncbi:MAG TPA: arginine--tRNA ligase [Thermoanaerobaculia bacterium]|nr:arginine--tRNA ligase [Thermoanaerobaculia bacterium]